MNVYQWYNSSVKPRIVQDCMDQVEFMTENVGGDTYTLIAPDHKQFDISLAVRSESDYLRCKVLSEDPEGCWLDADCEIINKFQPPHDGKPYVSQGMAGKANGDVIIANGNSGIFSDILEDFNNLSEAQRTPGWLQAWFRINMSRIRLIPPGYYRHFCLCHTSHLVDGQEMGLFDGSVIKKVNNELIVTRRG